MCVCVCVCVCVLCVGGGHGARMEEGRSKMLGEIITIIQETENGDS